MPTSSVRITAI